MLTDQGEALARAGIDLDDALDRFGGNAALYARLAKRYADDGNLAALEEAIAAGDGEGAYRAAHALKGVAGNLSLSELHRLASAASEALRAGDVAAACDLLPALKEAHARALEVLAAL